MRHKARHGRFKKYDIDKAFKEWLTIPENRAEFEAKCLKEEKKPGWERRVLMGLIFPDPEPAKETKTATLDPKPIIARAEKPYVPILGIDIFSKIVRAQSGRCYRCGEKFSSRLPATRDHVRPKALGGSNYQNVLAACGPCNQEKSDRMPYPCEAIYLAGTYAQLARLERRRGRKTYANPDLAA